MKLTGSFSDELEIRGGLNMAVLGARKGLMTGQASVSLSTFSAFYNSFLVTLKLPTYSSINEAHPHRLYEGLTSSYPLQNF